MLARLSIFNVFYFLFVLLPLLLGVPFINNEVWIFFPSSLAVLLICIPHSTEFLKPFFVSTFPIPHLSFMVISTCFHFLQMHLSEKMIFHLEMVILRKNMRILDTIQKFFCKLGMKIQMHLGTYWKSFFTMYIMSSSDLPKLRTSFLKCVIC